MLPSNLQSVNVQEEDLEEDPERLGLHVDDRLNIPEEDGRIQVWHELELDVIII